MTAEELSAAAASLLGAPIVEATPLPVSFVNTAWRVEDAAGMRYVVKVGSVHSEAKWRSAHRAVDLAASVGVPVAPLVGSGRHGDRLVRAFAWVEGRNPVPGELDDDGVRRLFTDLGAAVRALHGIEFAAFGSRLDDSAPSFDRWPDYVGYRLAAIRHRCLATKALDERELDHVCRVAERLADEIGEDARPTLCHRDLHAGNLLVDQTGRLAAILDFDMAEVWDTAGEFDRLDRQLFPAFPGAREWFDSASRDGLPHPPRWDARVRLVSLLEAVNTLPNAITGGFEADYAEDARRRMRALAGPA